MTDKTAEILILEEVHSRALESIAEQFALVGLREWITTPAQKKYDFLFHCLENVPYEELREKFAIPLLPHQESIDDTRGLIYEIHKTNSGLITFVVKSEGSFAHERGGTASIGKGKHLKFYDVGRIDLGTEIISRKKGYTITNEGELRKIVPNWEEVEEYLSKLRTEIDEHYK